MVRSAEIALYRPHPKYMDAFFFPNIENVKKVVKYVSYAKNTIELAIFTFTNDDLANALFEAHNRGVQIRIIADDEQMKGQGADI